MKKLIFILIASITFTVLAEGKRVSIRVDGLACPYCAYGIEKKLKKISGDGVLEVNAINQRKNRLNGINDPNSNGTALENDYIVRAGIRFNF